jgi:hypothetical protein
VVYDMSVKNKNVSRRDSNELEDMINSKLVLEIRKKWLNRKKRKKYNAMLLFRVP